MSWPELSQWWRTEVATDRAYEDVVTPLLLEILCPKAGHRYVDLGCGEGRLMRSIKERGADVHGVDLSEDLVTTAGVAVVATITSLPLRTAGYDAGYSVLTLEHVAEEDLFFRETARVIRPGGLLVLVVNHPIWTAPHSTPISDSDGEILWRPGEYFSRGSSTLPAGDATVTFHHRTMSELLTSAAKAGWQLEYMIEQPHHEFEDQAGIPRLLACRWRLLP